MPSILLVTQDLQRAGAQRQCIELALGLQKEKDWSVEVTAIEPDGPLAIELQNAGIPLHPCPRSWRWDLAPAHRIGNLARTRNHQIIYSFLFLPNFYARISRLAGHNSLVISSLRSTGVAGWPRYLTEILMAPLCDLIIANSDSGRNALIARGVAARRIVVVRNGLNLERFITAKEGDVRLDSSRNGKRIGMVARMEVDKDHVGLVKAFQRVLVSHPQSRLVLAGDGSLRPKIEMAIRKAGIVNSVDLLGETDHPESVYSGLDIYVQPSQIEEGTSNSIVEAMTSGLPVVATNSGGNREVVLHGQTGFIVPPRQPGSLASSIVSLLDDPALARQMGQAGANRAMALFSRRAMVSATIKIFRSLLDNRLSARR